MHRQASGSDESQTLDWIDELRIALGRYMWGHSDHLNAYLDTLTLVRDAVGRGDRRTVKQEMDTYFSMLLADRAYGITDATAKELSTAALRVTPIRAYGIVIPRSLQE